MVKLFPPIVLQEFHLYYHQFKTQTSHFLFLNFQFCLLKYLNRNNTPEELITIAC
jgi:hypothetical protein